MSDFGFDLIAGEAGGPRRGRLHTAHGTVETPTFMAVGTAGTVKGMTMDAVRATGTQIVLGNTYHLMLRPTAERVAALGGLHQMMDWPGPILTDSGGFQVMSLTDLRKMSEDGVEFRSHIDGSKHMLSPERSMEIQYLLDATITMAFDECTPHPAEHAVAEASLALSMRWAERCRTAFIDRDGYALFGITQGSLYPDLRARSADILKDLDFPGYAIGGLAVGEGQQLMFEVLDYHSRQLPVAKPRYLMGVGTPHDLVGAVKRGVDMFDCVLPTRSGRTGRAFTRFGQLNMRNAIHKDSLAPIDPTCTCPTCRKHSRGYIHHLLKSDEILGPMLLTWHNVHYYQTLMQEMRAAIDADDWANFEAKFLADQAQGRA